MVWRTFVAIAPCRRVAHAPGQSLTLRAAIETKFRRSVYTFALLLTLQQLCGIGLKLVRGWFGWMVPMVTNGGAYEYGNGLTENFHELLGGFAKTKSVFRVILEGLVERFTHSLESAP